MFFPLRKFYTNLGHFSSFDLQLGYSGIFSGYLVLSVVCFFSDGLQVEDPKTILQVTILGDFTFDLYYQ